MTACKDCVLTRSLGEQQRSAGGQKALQRPSIDTRRTLQGEFPPGPAASNIYLPPRVARLRPGQAASGAPTPSGFAGGAATSGLAKK